MIAGTANAVNLADGIDGLAAGTGIIALFTFAAMNVIAWIRSGRPGHRFETKLDLALVGAALIGAGVGFLWYNAFPADVFMGDTGSMAIGGALATFAIFTKTIFLLLLIGGIFVIEALSVIIQVFTFKYLGRRVFLMTPIHHHFEMKAWSETKIMVRFWIVDRDPLRDRLRALLPLLHRVPLSELPQRALVLGLARSGRAAVAALERRGVEVAAADRELGNDGDLSLLDGVEVLVKSPGVPREAPLVAEAERRGVPVWSEVELGYRLIQPKLIGVTGTNGKTTTCELLGAMTGAPVAGNVGRALTELDGQVEPGAWVVCELSSFQLEDVHELACEIAVLLNLEPDHLDRHGSFEAYRDAKLRIFERAGTKIVPRGLGLEGIEFSADDPLPAEPLIRGAHNRENAAAATAAARAAGAPDERIAEALRTFPGVPHRLEPVGEVEASATSTTRRRRTSPPPCGPWPPTRTSPCT